MKLVLSSGCDTPHCDTAAFSLFQSPFWARFQSLRGIDARMFTVHPEPGIAGCDPSGAVCDPVGVFPLLVLIREGPAGMRYAYVPRGPEVELEEGERGSFLEQLSLALAPLLEGGIACIRYDTAFDSPYTDRESWSSSGQWKGAPRAQIRELRMNFGTEYRALRKAPRDHLCPDTVILDLRSTEDEILSRMRQTTRNSIRRALKSGAEFRVRGAEWLPEWYRLYRETAERKGFYFDEPEYFFSLLSCSFAGGRAGAGGLVPRFAVISAEKDGIPLAGCIIAAYGKHGYYMYAGSSTVMRECMPNYGIQLEAIRWLKSQGCETYDLMGVPPNGDPNHSMYGLYTFKTGLGGSLVHYTGCWDWPLDDEQYILFRNAENLQ
ncbi:MAG: peptidoglycan bridge formation glycyltransferase FemA/FemB family protein [Treponema sp.]|nr:MAG: peptidoglycan bridge formation glycyltransferase FemA/FemB family protein [Treponema sp.]